MFFANKSSQLILINRRLLCCPPLAAVGNCNCATTSYSTTGRIYDVRKQTPSNPLFVTAWNRYYLQLHKMVFQASVRPMSQSAQDPQQPKPAEEQQESESGEEEGSGGPNELATRERIGTVPNVLCAIRIGATPVIGWLVVHELYLPACLLFTLAGFTDLLDGMIARKFPSQRSLLGSIIDPVADKLLISTLFVTLTYKQLIPVPVTALVLARDILLVVGGLVMRYRMLEPPVTFTRFFDTTVSSVRVMPTRMSKLNTVLQLALVSASLASPVFEFVDHPALRVLQIVTACTTVYSGLQYGFHSGMLRVKMRKRKQ